MLEKTMEHSINISENVTEKNSPEAKNSFSEAGMLRCRKKHGKPKSAGNAGFRKHNKMKFMKTEKLRKLNGK